MRDRLEEADEGYDLVMAVGPLQPRHAACGELIRHLLTAAPEITSDVKRGVMAVSLADSLQISRLEMDMLEPKVDRT